jgi:hypothetical protein
MQTIRMLEAEWKQLMWGSTGTGKEEDESSIGSVWAAGFHHVTARSHLECVLKIMNCLLLQFSDFFQASVNHR